MNIGQRWQGLVQKARDLWADLTEDESGRSGTTREAVHQRFGGTEKHSELARGSSVAERAKRSRDETSMDRGPDDAILANPAARAGRAQMGGRPTDSAQQAHAQEGLQSRQYTQQGGSGIQKTIGQQTGGQVGSNEVDRDDEQLQRNAGRSGGQQRR